MSPRRVGRLRGRTSIETARRGRRTNAGSVWVRWAAPTGSDAPPFPEVGYAIGRTIGTAVVRNRLRRRLRAVVNDVAPDLAPGRYLIGAAPEAADLTFAQLSAVVQQGFVASGALPAEPRP